MDGLDASVFDGGGPFLICTSTYGNGDVPDNAQALFNSLETEKPNLGNVTYGVIALGDTTYKDTYCQGGIRFDKLLTELGAQPRGRDADARRQFRHHARRRGGTVGCALGGAASGAASTSLNRIGDGIGNGNYSRKSRWIGSQGAAKLPGRQMAGRRRTGRCADESHNGGYGCLRRAQRAWT